MVELAYTADSKSAGSYPMRVRVSPAAPFLGSSMAESAAVNRVVVGSNPTRGAKMRRRPTVRTLVFGASYRSSNLCVSAIGG